MNKPTQRDDIPSSDSDVIILDEDRPAETVRNRAMPMPTLPEEEAEMGSAEEEKLPVWPGWRVPEDIYMSALAMDGGVSPYPRPRLKI
jgi:hypothetical protein